MTIMRYDSYGDSFEEDPGNGRYVLLEDVQKALNKVAPMVHDGGNWPVAIRAHSELLCAIAKELGIAIFTAQQKREIETAAGWMSYDFTNAPTHVVDEIVTIKKD